MPLKDKKERAEYDRKRYELKLLKQGIIPRTTKKIDEELEKARANMELLTENPIENYHTQKRNNLTYYEQNDPIDKRMFNEKLQIKHGGAFTPLIFEDEIEEEFDDTEDVDEEDYDPKNYYDHNFNSYINLSERDMDKLEEEITDFMNVNEYNDGVVKQIVDKIKERLNQLDSFKYINVSPIRKRIIISILSELKNYGLLRNPDGKTIMKELDNYF
jgi:hypothetical protein